MHTIITVFLKELKVTLRDKRTLVTTVLLPAIVFPLMFIISGTITQKIKASKKEEKIKLAILNAPTNLDDNYFPNNQFKLLSNYTIDAAQVALKKGGLDAFIDFENTFKNKINSNKTGNISLHYKSTNLVLLEKISEQLKIYNNDLLKKRLIKQNISKEFIAPLKIKEIDTATKKEQLGEIVGGLLPYLFVLFCFMGCMYPAIELTTGENEKNTLETLLTTPSSRLHILIGKILTMSIVGVFSAVTIIIGIFICVNFLNDIPKEITTSIQEILSIKFLILLLGMLIPLAFFFSSSLSALAMTAQSFKEAQSKIQPLLFFIILPVLVGFIPGVIFDWKTAFIPILNVSLSTKAIIADTLDLKLYAITIISTILIALIAILISYKQFSKESTILN